VDGQESSPAHEGAPPAEAVPLRGEPDKEGFVEAYVLLGRNIPPEMGLLSRGNTNYRAGRVESALVA
jgi:hypothetical protein